MKRREKQEFSARTIQSAPVQRGDRKTIWLSLVPVALVLLGLLAPPLSAGAAPDRKPNILLIFIDDLGYGELGCQGNPEIPTPHVDALAATGVRCTAGYVTASYCSPSRAGLLTGRYQTRFGHELNPVGRHNLHPDAGLPQTERTLADRLKAAGYATGLVGKWHLGGADKCHPQRRGFDEFYGFLHEGHFYVPPPYPGVTSFLRRKTLPHGATGRVREGNIVWTDHLGHDEPPYDRDNPLLRGTRPLVEPEYLTDALAREAVAFIDRHRDAPFFLYLSFNAVHSPMQATAADLQRFAHVEDVHRRVFAAMLASLDDAVGAVMAKLQAAGLDRHTLVFCISDNGGPTKELTSSNLPLRGGKGSLYEGGIRVPFIVRWPGKLPAGRVYRQPVITTDVAATVCAAAGISNTGEPLLDGVDLVPFFRGDKAAPPHDVLYWRMGNKTALRCGPWKIVRHGRGGDPAAGFELYRLDDDMSETNDLAAARPDVLERLLAHWRRLDGQMVPPVWRP